MRKTLTWLPFLILIFGLVSLVVLVGRQVWLWPQAKGGPASLFLSHTGRTYQVGEDFTVNILLDTSGKDVAGLDISLNYDPLSLEVKRIYSNVLFNQEIEFYNKVDEDRILLSLGSFVPFRGSGTLASICFRAKSFAMPTRVNFDPFPLTKVVEAETAEDILGMTSGASYTLKQVSTSPAPTLKPTPSVEVEPTMTLVPTKQLPTEGPTLLKSPTLRVITPTPKEVETITPLVPTEVVFPTIVPPTPSTGIRFVSWLDRFLSAVFAYTQLTISIVGKGTLVGFAFVFFAVIVYWAVKSASLLKDKFLLKWRKRKWGLN